MQRPFWLEPFEPTSGCSLKSVPPRCSGEGGGVFFLQRRVGGRGLRLRGPVFIKHVRTAAQASNVKRYPRSASDCRAALPVAST